jgi:hypothetical protein
MTEDKIKQLVQESELPEEDKIMWDEFLDMTDDNQKEVLVDFLEDDEDRLLFLTDNIKTKKEYLEDGDPQLMDKILDAEREALLEIES